MYSLGDPPLRCNEFEEWFCIPFLWAEGGFHTANFNTSIRILKNLTLKEALRLNNLTLGTLLDNPLIKLLKLNICKYKENHSTLFQNILSHKSNYHIPPEKRKIRILRALNTRKYAIFYLILPFHPLFPSPFNISICNRVIWTRKFVLDKLVDVLFPYLIRITEPFVLK